MSRLFTGLPAPAGSRHEVELEEHEELTEPSYKRQKVDTTDQAVAPTQAAFSFADPVVAALVKITTHISSSKKFNNRKLTLLGMGCVRPDIVVPVSSGSTRRVSGLAEGGESGARRSKSTGDGGLNQHIPHS